MKTRYRFFTALFLLSAVVLSVRLHAQDVKWTIKWEDPAVFIQNKGQFPLTGTKSPDVLYAYDNGQTVIYFTRTGVTYSFAKKVKREDNDRDRKDGDKDSDGLADIKKDVVNMTWENANANVRVDADDAATDYYSYSVNDHGAVHNISDIPAYHKITYRNLYNGIDVEFTFHPNGGIKYALIVHPGADVAQVKMKYSSTNRVTTDVAGNILISTLFGDITDHAPTTFYNNDHSSIITSQFARTGKTVSFALGNYDHSQTIVIDPWTVSPPFSNSNKVWECERDNSGNVYLYGGDTPMRLKKYSSAGALQWTYNSPWDTANYWVGTLITDLAGNSYITSGSNGEVSKVSTAGALVWHNNPNGAFGPLFEYWHLAFNCDQTKLICGGMRAQSPFSLSSFHGVVINLNLANGAVVSYTTVGSQQGLNIDEVRSICSSPNGNFYFLTLDSVGCVNSTLTPQWRSNSGYNFAYGIPNYGVTNQGISAIRATGNFIYTQNGVNLHKRNINTGAILGTAAIPSGNSTSAFGYNSPGNSGLDIDSCGNVYVGSTNQVVKYDGNLNQLSTAATTSAVYDVAVTGNGEVIVCGNGFASDINMSSCHPVQAVCVASTLSATSTSTNPLCNGQCTGTGTATPSGGTAPYTYSWNTVPSQSTQTATALCAGTYTCTVTDAASGSTQVVVTITQPSVLSATSSSANVSCNGGNNGSATVTASGGTPGYTYSWSPSGGTNATANNLTQGNYTCTITDSHGCTTTQSFAITQPSVLSATSSSANVSCNGGNNGSATVTASGGSPGYTYSWSPSGGTNATANNLTQGNYTCTITDSHGCTTTQSFAITQPSVLSATSSSANVSCNGGNNGSATVTASGGSPGYTYSWSPSGGTNATANNLTQGNYTCTITDSHGCTTTQSFSITQPAALTASASATQTGCSVNTGTATATPGGGTGAYTYSWAPSGGTNATANNLGAGTYTCTITDANGCTTTTNATVTSSGGPTVSVQSTGDATCFGSTNGTATVSATGNGPFTYSWAPSGGTNATANNLGAATYTVTVTDNGGCTTAQTVVINQPTQLSGSATSTQTGCSTSTGTASVTASGGTGAYTYSWTPSGGNAATANNLSAGNYTCTITDANGCTTTASTTVTSAGGPSVTVQSTTNVLCNGGNNGSATVNVTSGSPPYTYSWSSGGTGATENNLAQGTYTVTVTDAGGCLVTQTVSITQPAALSANTTSNPATCGNNNGDATATASGGTGAYTYSWSNAQTTQTATNLAGGSYTVTVTDANGCSTTSTVIVTNIGAPTVSLQSSSNANCFGSSDGSASVNASGGSPPYTYSWSPSGGTNATANNLAAGTYTVTVTGSNGCTQTQTVTIAQPSAINVTSASTPENCGANDGTATATASGGTGAFTYSWNNGATTSSISGLGAGAYSVTVTDANGCTQTSTVNVGSSGSATADAGNAVTISSGQSTQLNGSGGGSYSWSPPDGLSCTNCQSPVASPTVTTTYTLTVTDSLGCTATDTVTVIVDIACGDLYLPNAFSPNGDHENDILFVRGNCIKLLQFDIYNRWGENVFSTSDPTIGWDGTWRGKACESAVFSYILHAELQDGTKIDRHGNITLVK